MVGGISTGNLYPYLTTGQSTLLQCDGRNVYYPEKQTQTGIWPVNHRFERPGRDNKMIKVDTGSDEAESVSSREERKGLFAGETEGS